MIDFRQHLQTKLIELVTTIVGPGTDPTNVVKKFDNHLYDVPVEQTPFVVVNVRTNEKAGDGEIGVKHDLRTWTAHIYYIDIDADYNTGDAKRDNILSRIEKHLEANKRLDNLEVTDSGGTREYVYDNDITAVTFDSSGQEEYYSFVSELYIELFTARS